MVKAEPWPSLDFFLAYERPGRGGRVYDFNPSPVTNNVSLIPPNLTTNLKGKI